MVSAHAASTEPAEFTAEEVSGVLVTMKRGKSCGPDGVSYELLRGLHQTSLDSLFNAVLCSRQQIPAPWFEGQLTFLPKVAKPSCPKDLRPIVLSPTTGKLFTKLMRIRPTCPPVKCGQLCAQQSSQALDGSLSLQRLIHLSNRWGLPLMATILHISAAFDSLHDSAVARYFLQCKPSREALLLQTSIAGTSIQLGMCRDSWSQKLHQGLLQGSSYSAEIFARVLDHHLSLLLPSWSRWNSTWLQGLHLILYADDIRLLATSPEEMRQKILTIQSHLRLIGLRLAMHKVQMIACRTLHAPLHVHQNLVIEPVDSFVFLGILVRFAVTAQMTLGRSPGRAMHSFWAFYGILRAGLSPCRDRLHLLHTYVASRWRWMSLAVRPTQAILKLLAVAHTNLLMWMCNPASDKLSGWTNDWVSQRKSVRMICQFVGQIPWPAVQVRKVWEYWGHAARLDGETSPMKHVLQLRNCGWTMLHPDCKRKRGNHPDVSVYLQELWDVLREPGDNLFWETQARDRVSWKLFTSKV